MLFVVAIVSSLALLLGYLFAHAGMSTAMGARVKTVAIPCAAAMGIVMVLATAEVWHIWALALH